MSPEEITRKYTPLEEEVVRAEDFDVVGADAAGGSREPDGVSPYSVAWLQSKIAADDLSRYPCSKVAWLNARPSASRAKPAKGQGKAGRHSRALFQGHWSRDGYPPLAAGLFTATAMTHLGDGAGAVVEPNLEAAMSWGLIVSNFLSGVSWGTALLMTLVAFLGGVVVGYVVVPYYFQRRSTAGKGEK